MYFKFSRILFGLHNVLETLIYSSATFITKLNFYQKKTLCGYFWVILYSCIIVKLATLVESDQKATFSIATTLRCRGGRYFIPWIASLYP